LTLATDLQRVAAAFASDVQVAAAREAEAAPASWLTRYFPGHVRAGFAPHHEAFWAWVWAIRAGFRPQPFVAIWPRGGAKSTSAELAVVSLSARGVRRYVLYVCETQDQADDHVANIASLLEQPGVARDYPRLGSRLLGKFGNSKGWRRNRLRTASGFTIDAIGLDTAARGVKLEDQRPDLLVLDDIDAESDEHAITAKKIRTLTRKLMPAGSSDLAVLAIQNLVHPDSVFAQLADGRAEMLADRIVSGPVPAVRDLAYEQGKGGFRVTGGTPSWAGQDLTVVQGQIDTWGLSAFLAEAQHEVEAPAGGMFDHLDFEHCTWDELPSLVRVVVWVDPAVTNTDASDSQGLQADGLGIDGKVYRLFSWEDRTSPQDALKRAILKAYELHAGHVGVETDQGGDTWESVYREALREALEEHPELRALPAPRFTSAKAGAGHGPKAHRASRMLVDYEHDQIVHVLGTHTVLEKALRRFPRTKPYDLVDASYWSWQDLVDPDVEELFEWDDPVSIGPDV
jgi:hypothetical protein